MPLFVSKDHIADALTSPTLDDKIEIFRSRIQGWQLDIAVDMERQINLNHDQKRPMKHAGYALISVLFSYFEMVGQILPDPSGSAGSRVTFGRGFQDVYPGLLASGDVDKVYKRVRCGMYHLAATKRGTIIGGGYKKPFEIDAADNVLMNPHLLVPAIQDHFNRLIAQLRDPNNATLRANFETQFLSQ